MARSYVEWQRDAAQAYQDVTDLGNELRERWDDWRTDEACPYSTLDECLRGELDISAAALRQRNYRRQGNQDNRNGGDDSEGNHAKMAQALFQELCHEHGIEGWTLRINDRLVHAHGQCVRSNKTVELSRRTVDEHPWEDIENTVRHEMAHVLTPPQEKSHGAAWIINADKVGAKPERCGPAREQIDEIEDEIDDVVEEEEEEDSARIFLDYVVGHIYKLARDLDPKPPLSPEEIRTRTADLRAAVDHLIRKLGE